MSANKGRPAPARPRRGNIKGFNVIAYPIAHAVVSAVSRPQWGGIENFPKSGPFIVAPNHVSEFDPVSMGYFLGYNGFEPRFLAKDALFKVPVIGLFLRWWGMIPVARGSNNAGDALVHAREALAEDAVVTIYFEGTITRDPAFWPMKGKTGLARLALDTRVPVVPIVQWGAQNVMDRYTTPRLHLRRPNLYIKVLPPIDYSDIEGDSTNREGVRELTGRLEEALMEGSAALRNEDPPEKPWDMKTMDGPGKGRLKVFSGWRAELARRIKSRDVLPVEPSVTRGRYVR